MGKVLENVNDGHNMETYFAWLSEYTEVWVEPLASNYEDMVTAILIKTPDPRLIPDNEQHD
jgi:hypothetical protein